MSVFPTSGWWHPGVLEDAGLAVAVMGPEVIPDLLNTLTNTVTDWRYRCTAASIIGRLGTHAQSASPALLQCLRDRNEKVRLAAGFGLEMINNLQYGKDLGYYVVPMPKDDLSDPALLVKAMTDCLGDESPRVRGMAARVLGRLREKAKPAVPAL